MRHISGVATDSEEGELGKALGLSPQAAFCIAVVITVLCTALIVVMCFMCARDSWRKKAAGARVHDGGEEQDVVGE